MLIATNRDFTILDETEDYIVVNKPAPLQVHPSTPDGSWTLWHGLNELLAYEMANGGQISIINRLDRETSGIVLVAKNKAAARFFGIAMQERRIKKTYLAIVHHWPEWDTHSLDAPILRQGEVMESRIWVKQMVHSEGVPCRTDFRVLKRTLHPTIGPIALVEASPITGRMHQIRVHLAYLNHPIVGDKIYGLDETAYLDFIERGWTAELEGKLVMARQCLHSARLVVESLENEKAWEQPSFGEMNLFKANG